MTFSISQALLLAVGLATSALCTAESPGTNEQRDAAVRNCVAFYRVALGDDCIHIREAHPDTFTMDELYKWNPSINKNCTNLQVGATICIRRLRKDCPSGA